VLTREFVKNFAKTLSKIVTLMSQLRTELKIITQLSLPLMVAFIAQKGIQLVDIIMMGRIGTHALAAGALGTSFFMTIFVFCVGTLSAIGVFISRALGAEQPQEVTSILLGGMALGALLSIPCMVLIWYAPAIFLWVGEAPSVVAETQLFLHALVWGIPGIMGFLVLREFISAFFLTKIVMLITLISIPLTIFANYLFIYGKLGLPALGIAGIGYAGAIIEWLMFFALLAVCLSHAPLKPYAQKRSLQNFPWRKVFAMLHLGAPSGFLYVLDVGMILMAVMMMGHFGEIALAAHQVAIMCVSITYSPAFALSMTTALRVGHAMGANDLARAKMSTYLSIHIGLIISVIIACLYLFAPNLLVHSFLSNQAEHDAAIKQLAAILLGIAALFQCCDALQAITAGALRGLKDTWTPMLLCITCYWPIGVGSAYLLAFHTSLGPAGVWYGITLGICSAAVVLALRFLWRFKREAYHIVFKH
jgi:MATE family multidrug resistance protein